ncbi:SDR family oxidoreductase [Roseovarius sp. A21]|uniref:SDR family oxidoreductase n=1 Tax=Roseovarius bejariae TaxID=2576383 RepID=A0A844CZ45_9RHOB|nr:SDR family oxidoreductase [Roseovarius bejariae]
MLYDSVDTVSVAKLGPLHTIKSDVTTVLITGGAGFLGSQLCDIYIKRKDRVLCLDDLSTGRIANIAHLLDRPNFEFVRHDVTERYWTEAKIDLIYNMACPASPPRYQLDPIKTFWTNVHGAETLLELAKAKGARILQASTSEVYGDPDITPQPEEYHGNVNTMGPRACYDEGKRAVETLFYESGLRQGIDTRIARIFNTYGPRMDPADGRVVSNFVTQALRGDDITIYGDGLQTRSFCYVDDLLRGLVLLMHSEPPIHTPVNLGNPGEFTMRELAEIVIEEVGSKSGITFQPLPQDDPLQRCPDITQAKALLGWQPKVSLRQGLRRTIPYFARELRNPSPEIFVAE